MNSDSHMSLCHHEDYVITHTVHFRGKIIAIDHVPAEVCTICGDVLFKPNVVRKIEAILQQRILPAQMMPLYEYA
jgi:YgiT-type zinc finger domain-containing protein